MEDEDFTAVWCVEKCSNPVSFVLKAVTAPKGSYLGSCGKHLGQQVLRHSKAYSNAEVLVVVVQKEPVPRKR